MDWVSEWMRGKGDSTGNGINACMRELCTSNSIQSPFHTRALPSTTPNACMVWFSPSNCISFFFILSLSLFLSVHVGLLALLYSCLPLVCPLPVHCAIIYICISYYTDVFILWFEPRSSPYIYIYIRLRHTRRKWWQPGHKPDENRPWALGELNREQETQ